MTETPDIQAPLMPQQCQTMAEVRAGVDAVDAALIALLARRFAYMDAAARIKPNRDAVRDEARKAQVIANARRAGAAAGLSEALIGELWEALVEQSIAYELDQWDSKTR
jgi:isochorismate pyruvate lyase